MHDDPPAGVPRAPADIPPPPPSPVASADEPPTPLSPAAPAPAPRPGRGARVAVWILSVLLVLLLGAFGVAAYLFWEAEQTIDDKDRQISELNDQLDERQQFGAAMTELMDTASSLDGEPMATLVPLDLYQRLADDAWSGRRNAALVAERTTTARAETDRLRSLIEAAEAERSGNATGTFAEEVLDALGEGYVRLQLESSAATCGDGTLGCVFERDPFVIHVEEADLDHPSMDDWGVRFLILHEYAHVLQYTNAEPTATASAAFGDDWEFMADCYALNALDAWSLHRQVWTSAYEYWDVDYGYGQVCDQSQRDAITTWTDSVGVSYEPVRQ